MDKEKYSIFDWIGFTIGIIVVGFLLFILIWPFIDPTPKRSASIQENINQLTDNNPKF